MRDALSKPAVLFAVALIALIVVVGRIVYFQSSVQVTDLVIGFVAAIALAAVLAWMTEKQEAEDKSQIQFHRRRASGLQEKLHQMAQVLTSLGKQLAVTVPAKPVEDIRGTKAALSQAIEALLAQRTAPAGASEKAPVTATLVRRPRRNPLHWFALRSLRYMQRKNAAMALELAKARRECDSAQGELADAQAALNRADQRICSQQKLLDAPPKPVETGSPAPLPKPKPENHAAGTAAADERSGDALLAQAEAEFHNFCDELRSWAMGLLRRLPNGTDASGKAVTINSSTPKALRQSIEAAVQAIFGLHKLEVDELKQRNSDLYAVVAQVAANLRTLLPDGGNPVVTSSTPAQLAESFRQMIEAVRAHHSWTVEQLNQGNTRLAARNNALAADLQTAQVEAAKLQQAEEQVRTLTMQLEEAQQACLQAKGRFQLLPPEAQLAAAFRSTTAEPASIVSWLKGLTEDQLALAPRLFADYARTLPRKDLESWVDLLIQTAADGEELLDTVFLRAAAFRGGIELFLALPPEKVSSLRPRLGYDVVGPLQEYLMAQLSKPTPDIYQTGLDLLEFSEPSSNLDTPNLAVFALLLLGDLPGMTQTEGGSSAAWLISAWHNAQDEHEDEGVLDELLALLEVLVWRQPALYHELPEILRHLLISHACCSSDRPDAHEMVKRLIGGYLGSPERFSGVAGEDQLLFVSGQVLPPQSMAALCMLLKPQDAAWALLGPGTARSKDAWLYIQPDILEELLRSACSPGSRVTPKKVEDSMRLWAAAKAEVCKLPSRTSFLALGTLAKEELGPPDKNERALREAAESDWPNPVKDPKVLDSIRRALILAARDMFLRHSRGLNPVDLKGPSGILTRMRFRFDQMVQAMDLNFPGEQPA